ncbi:MAG TPA: indolepyruvate ferredoxin oxidoreductase subunit beta [Methanoculleus sp.]|nr:indolepyruvate ferredoxin oxidoreductase subunit beta [Methanoculleus sp.]
MTGSFDILIVGVGGQGTILASNVLGEACLIEGRHVAGAETHGMAQRGGSVESHIRIDAAGGPLISPGTADLLIAFDLLEALRYRHFLAPGGVMVAAEQIIVPTPVFQQKLAIPTPEAIIERLGGIELCRVDAAALAVEAGSILAQNIVMLGAASGFMPLAAGSLIKAVMRCVPPKTVAINVAAFEKGMDAGEACRTA